MIDTVFHKDEDWGIGIDVDDHDSIGGKSPEIMENDRKIVGGEEHDSDTVRSPLSTISDSPFLDDSLDGANVKASGWKVYTQANTESPKATNEDAAREHNYRD